MALVKKTTDMGWPEADALWLYTVLPEPLLSSELKRLSFAHTHGDTDVVTFQPCPNPEQSSQDRFVIRDWHGNGTWMFRAVFDGQHAGHETADYTAENLPTSQEPAPSEISDALTHAISSFDASIGQALLDLFPDKEVLAKMTKEEIQSIINDNGPNSAIVLRCMRGTTVLISIVDPTNLGDCAAVLGTRDTSGGWNARVLSSAHNGENQVEADIVKREHPGEPECMLYDRILGAIAVTRAVGDFTFKLPAVYTERVFLNSHPGFMMQQKVRDFIGRNKTAPYMSGIPDVKHVNLAAEGAHESRLVDMSEDDRLKLEEKLSKHWVHLVGPGGDDVEMVSRNITVEMTMRWMDDTTVLVQRLPRTFTSSI
ncbi:hypothetical protein BDZ97DRAFT_1935957 [Flammula alnicola]|nr:hypothetical protein BDZ97DRAFT_1935957 [Flammula alnicola]